jgi:hypothetical protein
MEWRDAQGQGYSAESGEPTAPREDDDMEE